MFDDHLLAADGSGIFGVVDVAAKKIMEQLGCGMFGEFFEDDHIKVAVVNKKESLTLFSILSCAFSKERIHLGSHKKQDWTLGKRRQSLEEILPLWFSLGQNIPKASLHDEGVAKLLSTLEKLIINREKEKVSAQFLQLFQVGFSDILVPRLVDTDYQGIIFEGNPQGSPLVLLSEGAKLIRSLFLQVEDHQLTILPCLPIELHSGRLFDIEASQSLSIDLEWSKKMIRTLTLHSKEESVWLFTFQKGIKSFRLRTSKHEKGVRIPKGERLSLKAEKTYFLDRFEK